MSDSNDGGRKSGGGKGGPRGGGFGKGPRPGGGGGGAPGGRSGGGDRPRSGKPGAGGAKFGGDRAGKPFRARPAAADGAPRGESTGGERKTFRPRTERPDGDRKPFVKREGGGERGSYRSTEGGERPARGEGDKTFTPRSRGMVSHGGAPKSDDGGEARPRSYGRLQHGDVAGESRRPPRESGERTERPRRERSDDDRAPRRDAAESPASDGSMRIAKRLARAGIASRRDAEGMIADGRITLNGKRLETPAIDVTMRDRIEVDGKPLPAIERTRLWLFHKPAGLVTTNRDPEGRTTVFDRLPEDMPRVLSIGRLDINTEGLLLLTNDGGLARVLELPATGWLRRYRVRARGEVTQAQLDELRQGVAVDGVFYGAIEATLDREQGSNVWMTLGLREGKNREVKRVLGHLGLDVNRLIRLSFGPFQLGDLDEGAVQEVKGRMLRDQLGERLIEEAGADFDAPIVNEFSNKPVAAPRRSEVSEERSERTERPAKPKNEWISASETAPNRKKFGERKRDDALGRLDTKAPRPDRGAGDRGGRTFEKRERPAFGASRDKPAFGASRDGDKPRRFGDRKDTGGADERPVRKPAMNEPRRAANVWMAPGARATGEKKKAEREDRAKRFPRTDGPRSDGPRPGGFKPRDGDRPRTGGSDRPRGDRPSGGGRPGGGSGGGGGRGPKG
ncbi:pseudouridine synthase [Aureimonas sp. AU12]|uniref:pseudouridine synthase n=1 Tax=Aureimonas sp. AU12 TaxID=1638161 RepID=UPI0009E91483|nr:pseudouridine synthase [Aureimonas sp. AU12]